MCCGDEQELVPYVTFAFAQVSHRILQLLRAERVTMTVLCFTVPRRCPPLLLPPRLVADWRAIERAISSLTNKAHSNYGWRVQGGWDGSYHLFFFLYKILPQT